MRGIKGVEVSVDGGKTAGRTAYRAGTWAGLPGASLCCRVRWAQAPMAYFSRVDGTRRATCSPRQREENVGGCQQRQAGRTAVTVSVA